MTGYRFNNICPHQIGKQFGSTGTFQSKKFHNCTSSKYFMKAKFFKKSVDVDSRFYRKIAAFFGKHTFNIHFFIIQKSAYVKISIVKFVLLVQKQVSKKRFQIFCCFVNPFLQVRVVCTDKSISEIPRMI